MASNLNTSYVKVQVTVLMVQQLQWMDLNTSYVKVQGQKHNTTMYAKINLNTSYVKVQAEGFSFSISQPDAFKYILC